jgi:REP element-mobilizing transposase RayT
MRRYHGSSLRRGRFSESGRIYLVTTVCFGRERLFESPTAAGIVIEELNHREQEGLCKSHCYVVMPDHVHWMLELSQRQVLSKVVARAKGRSARRINRALNCLGARWQAGFHDHAVRRIEDLENLANYTILNPVRAGLVARREDYPYWWSRWHPR